MSILDDILGQGKAEVIRRFPAAQRGLRAQIGAIDAMLARAKVAADQGHPLPSELLGKIRENRGFLVGQVAKENELSQSLINSASQAVADGRIPADVIKSQGGMGLVFGPVLAWLAEHTVVVGIIGYVSYLVVTRVAELLAIINTNNSKLTAYSMQIAAHERQFGIKDTGGGGGGTKSPPPTPTSQPPPPTAKDSWR